MVACKRYKIMGLKPVDRKTLWSLVFFHVKDTRGLPLVFRENDDGDKRFFGTKDLKFSPWPDKFWTLPKYIHFQVSRLQICEKKTLVP